jgi:hypothetical protein
MSHSKFKIQNPNFPLPRSGPFTAKPGFFLGQVVGDSMNRRDSWSHRTGERRAGTTGARLLLRRLH